MTITLWRCERCGEIHCSLTFAKHDCDEKWTLLCDDCLDYASVFWWRGDYVTMGPV